MKPAESELPTLTEEQAARLSKAGMTTFRPPDTEPSAPCRLCGGTGSDPLDPCDPCPGCFLPPAEHDCTRGFLRDPSDPHSPECIAREFAKLGIAADDVPIALETASRIMRETPGADPLAVAVFIGHTAALANLRGAYIYSIATLAKTARDMYF